MIARATRPSSATSSSAITMISADRMKSVRVADETTFFSCSAASAPAAASGSWAFASCPENFSHSFSAPS